MAVLKGGDKLEAYLTQMAVKVSNAGTLSVGFLEGTDYPSVPGEESINVATVAALQNFGAPAAGIPPRPFFSNMIKDKSEKWPDQLGALLTANNMDAHKALTLMGKGIEKQLR